MFTHPMVPPRRSLASPPVGNVKRLPPPPPLPAAIPVPVSSAMPDDLPSTSPPSIPPPIPPPRNVIPDPAPYEDPDEMSLPEIRSPPPPLTVKPGPRPPPPPPTHQQPIPTLPPKSPPAAMAPEPSPIPPRPIKSKISPRPWPPKDTELPPLKLTPLRPIKSTSFDAASSCSPPPPLKPRKQTAAALQNSEEVYEDPDSLSAFEWFDESLSRKDAERLVQDLRADGSFVVRPSSSKDRDVSYSMTVLYNGHAYNLKIRKRSDDRFAIGEKKANEETFDSIPNLVTHFYSKKLSLCAAKADKSGETSLRPTKKKMANK